MKLLLEMIKSATAYAGDEMALGDVMVGLGRKLSIQDLQTLQHQVGDLNHTCRTLIEKIKYAEVEE